METIKFTDSTKTYNCLYTGPKIFFPECTATFEISGNAGFTAVKTAAETYQNIMIVTDDVEGSQERLRDSAVTNNLCSIGTVCSIKSFLQTGVGVAKVTLVGVARARITSHYVASNGVLVASVEENHSFEDKTVGQCGRSIERTRNLFRDIVKGEHKYPNSLVTQINLSSFPAVTCDMVANLLLETMEDRLAVLKVMVLVDRIELLNKILERELVRVSAMRSINEKVRANLDKNQRDYYLREQIRVINEELGDEANEIAELCAKIDACGMPFEVSEKARKELKRLEKANPMAPEMAVIRTYIENLLEVPWVKESVDEADLNRAREVLDTDHYGMAEVKDRIIEHLAVAQLKAKNKALEIENGIGTGIETAAGAGAATGTAAETECAFEKKQSGAGQILCFVGPPGVGKTSIAESVARALRREFVRVSLGGVRDESEIRGHRRTYIGAMPGKIIAGMKKAKTINPVFLLDEIDKMGSDHKGDPASAMLEVLDPTQNKTFSDHYLEVPYDLSRVLFICTANDESEIPWALQDRLEIINLSSYTLVEKVKIAQQFLLPRAECENGLGIGKIDVETSVLGFVVEQYTREAGVRELSRVISGLCRKVALGIVCGEIDAAGRVKLAAEDVVRLLGKEKYSKDDLDKKATVGVVNGLGYTAAGGDILKLEVALIAGGKGELKLTGNLGNVMKESAQLALSITKSLAKDYGIDPAAFRRNDIHIHVPSGAAPKDGPSAGVALVVALISAFSGKPVRGDYALTGEITLSGRVLEIGGVREKVLSAYRYGIDNVIMPIQNQKSLEKVPEEVKEKLNFVFANNIGEVLGSMLISG